MRIATTLLMVVFLFSVLYASSLAQPQNKGAITGRVVTEDGAGLPGISVTLTNGGTSQTNSRRTTSTDDEGNFRFADLPPRAYSLRAENSRAFVRVPQTAAERAQPRYYRIGESVSLTMMRGGVITGRVTNAVGAPLIALPLKGIMVRDADGNPVTSYSDYTAAVTDDRGIYRFYGLTPGTYIVLANSGNPYWGSQASLYDNEAPTYYPSSTRDTAAEIQVTSGGEATGIDIRYRGERGHAISGKLVGNKATANIVLLQVGTGAQIATNYGYYRNGTEITFDFFGIPDGEYEVSARADSSAEEQTASQPRRVTVRSADVTGLELRMLPLGSIAGRIVIEAAQTPCDKPVKTNFEEIVLSARPEEKLKSESEPISRPVASEAAANDKGEFVLAKLNASRYRLAINSLNENLYVKSFAAPTALTSKPPAAAKPATAASTSSNTNGVLLKQGEKLTGFTVTIAEGAASLGGILTPEKSGGRMPSRVRIHLVPAETISADDVLRYAETLARNDGAFLFTNIAPGRYWLLPRAVSEDESVDRPAALAAWDTIERAKLRKQAEALRVEFELKACQRLTDQTLKYLPAAK